MISETVKKLSTITGVKFDEDNIEESFYRVINHLLMPPHKESYFYPTSLYVDCFNLLNTFNNTLFMHIYFILASRNNAPPEILELLSKKYNNKDTNISIVEEIWIKEQLAINVNLSVSGLKRLHKFRKDTKNIVSSHHMLDLIGRRIASHPSVPATILFELVEENNSFITDAVVNHPNYDFNKLIEEFMS